VGIEPFFDVLPARVRRKVIILGVDYEAVLRGELDEEALALIKAPVERLLAHRGHCFEARL